MKRISNIINRAVPVLRKGAAGMTRWFFVASMLLVFMPLGAETVSQKEAKAKAQRFFDLVYDQNSAPVKYVYNGKRLTTDRLFTPFYVYNHPRGGFVIISAENKVFPILAYSLKDTFDPESIGESRKAMLRNYALDIEEVRYDPRVPEKAIAAWGDFDGYVDGILKAGYESTDPTITMEEAEGTLTRLWTTDEGLDSYADLYTPDQWSDMVNEELRKRGSAALGYIDSRGLHPAVVFGRKGDYYRIRFEDADGWHSRLMAGELSGDRQLLSTLSPLYVAPAPREEVPFAFYDSFLEDQRREQEAAEQQRMMLDMKPVVKSVGGGHFDIVLPEDVTLAMLYNIGGSHIGRRTYRHTNVAHINIESEPAGFYFALIIGESGKPYGVKLYR